MIHQTFVIKLDGLPPTTKCMLSYVSTECQILGQDFRMEKESKWNWAAACCPVTHT